MLKARIRTFALGINKGKLPLHQTKFKLCQLGFRFHFEFRQNQNDAKVKFKTFIWIGNQNVNGTDGIKGK